MSEEVTLPSSGAPAFKLNKEDGKKILKGFAIAVGGACLTYLASVVPNVDFGEWTPVVVALFSCLVNIAQRFFLNYSK